MSEIERYSLLMTTVATDAEADALATGLVQTRLAACVQVSRITSHYVWKGAATKNDELLLLIKTRASKVPGIQQYVETHHSYETPELIELPITSGLPGYLHWIDQVVT